VTTAFCILGFVIKPCQFRDCILHIKEIGGKQTMHVTFGFIHVTVLLWKQLQW